MIMRLIDKIMEVMHS